MQYHEIEYFHNNQNALTVLGDQDLREPLADIIYIIPKDTIDSVLMNCVFLMINKEMCGGFSHKGLLKGRNVIAFHDMLYSQDTEKKADIILHEIAHCVLDRNIEGLPDEEYDKNEKDANALKDKWINDWEKYLKTQEENNLRI